MMTKWAIAAVKSHWIHATSKSPIGTDKAVYSRYVLWICVCYYDLHGQLARRRTFWSGDSRTSDFPPCREQLWDKSISHGFLDLQLCAVYLAWLCKVQSMRENAFCMVFHVRWISHHLSETHGENNPSHMEYHTNAYLPWMPGTIDLCLQHLLPDHYINVNCPAGLDQVSDPDH